jgi:single-strand DNA-binding protein
MANIVILMGRLGADPEVRRVGNDNTAVVDVSVATKDGKDTEWHNVNLWERQAELISRCKKGEMVFIQGRLKTDQYTDREGNKRRKTYVRAFRFEFCGSSQQQSQGGAQGRPSNPYGDDDLNF